MFRKNNFGENPDSKKSQSQLYAEAFGEGSKFGRKIPVAEIKKKPKDELSSEARAYAAIAEGLCSSEFGS